MSFRRRLRAEILRDAPGYGALLGALVPYMVLTALFRSLLGADSFAIAFPVAVMVDPLTLTDHIPGHFFAGVLLYALLGGLIGYAIRALCHAVQRRTGERP